VVLRSHTLRGRRYLEPLQAVFTDKLKGYRGLRAVGIVTNDIKGFLVNVEYVAGIFKAGVAHMVVAVQGKVSRLIGKVSRVKVNIFTRIHRVGLVKLTGLCGCPGPEVQVPRKVFCRLKLKAHIAFRIGG